MNLLEQLHKVIDAENWDIKDQDLINKSFQEVNTQLLEMGEQDLLIKSEKERETFSFSKSPDGIKWKIQGTKTLEDGIQKSVEWPDINLWTEKDFQYILERFSETNNVFARSEYGLLLYFSGKLNPFQCLKLFNDLLQLSKRYYEAIKGPDKTTYYAVHFYNTLALALKIASYKRKAPGFSNELEQALLFVEEVHKSWNKAEKYLLRTVIDLTDLVSEYYPYALQVINITGFLERNNEAVEEQVKTYTWGGIYIIDENIRLAKKMGHSIKVLIKRKAELYEKLASERPKGDQAIITFIESALRLYKEINETNEAIRLEEQFKKIKTDGSFSSYHTQLPKEESERITKLIQQEILQKEERDILMNFVFCPMYLSIESIQQNAESSKKNYLLSSMAGTNISDKFGNTIAKYPGSSEEWAFLQSYNFQFQIGTQSLIYFFIEAFKADKITETGIINVLKESWIGEIIKRNYNNQEFNVIPLDLIKPPITLFIRELNKWRNEPGYTPELIPATDSLVIKIEGLLRYFCDRLGISTFRLRDDGLLMECNLDEILASLENKPETKTNFQEDDRKFIKYVLSEKAGENLRNKVAHGLMDNFEYSIDKTILAFTIIMRLAKYNFKTSNNE